MARKFINMYQDHSDFSGYYIVEYIDENGNTKKDRFDTDIDAQEFYLELMQERNTTQSE
jgi:hypothetical protein